MFKIRFILFSITTLICGCSEAPKCLPTEESFSYLSIPTTPLGDSRLGTAYVGKTIVTSLNETNPNKKYQQLDPTQADKHMLSTSKMMLESGGPHDAVMLAAAPTPIPDYIKGSWVRLARGVDPGPNGCGIYATAVCNRKLGLTTSLSITQQEWNQVYQDLGSFNGITPLSYIANYYARQGFCTKTEPLRGYAEDYVAINNSQLKGCDVKMFFARKSSAWFSPYSNPHIETLVAAPPDTSPIYAYSNSWGNYAEITGGYCTPFTHGKNKNYAGDDEFAWPAHDARVWVQTTCRCQDLEKQLPNLDEMLKAPIPTWQQP